MVERCLEQIVRDALPPGIRRVLVAVSGGLDSMVLLHCLHRLAPSCGLVLEAAHLDHGIRSESVADAEFVTAACAGLGIVCRCGQSSVPEQARDTGLSLEMAARNARRTFLRQSAAAAGCGLIALAHHREDQVETFLLRLVRGSGRSGLCGMTLREGPWWRPLLHVPQSQLKAYARHHRLSWVEDSSNRDTVHQRNLLRLEVMPPLRRINPRFAERVTGLQRQFATEEAYWSEQVTEHFPTLLLDDRDGLRLSIPALRDRHRALRLRLFREALDRIRGDLQGIAEVHLEALDGLIGGSRSQAQLDLPRCWAARRYEQLWLRNAAPERSAPYELQLPLPGELELPDGRLLRATLEREISGESDRVVEFCHAQLTFPLRVRNRRPRDRFAPAGMQGRKKLKEYFVDSRTELEERHRQPLLVAGEELLWVIGRRRSGCAPACFDNGPVVRLELL